jgi:serpin B
MKKFIVCVAGGLVALVSCMKEDIVKDPIDISSPTPTEEITKVSLNETQKGYVRAGNAMAFRFLKEIYQGKNVVCSPLSLQYALAMTANGASGETLQEIIDFLGYGADGIDALNEYSRILLEQLPAVDLDVDLKVTDALLVNAEFPLLPAFQKTVQDNYYAAVDNMDFTDPSAIAARINEWARRNTNGFIDKVLEPNEISADAVAYLMNALYFKAKWSGNEYEPMFREYATMEDKFTLSDGSTKQVSYMRNTRYHQYAKMDGYMVLAIPYANGKFNMYILLPDDNNLEGLLDKLQGTSWNSILNSFKRDAKVSLKLPKFDIENKFNLSDALKALGVKKAFERYDAQFDRMFDYKPGYYYWIEKVIQKARISVAEWGTEAAAVTIVEMGGESAPGPEPEIKYIDFFADHPFVYLIGESTSGTILFEGVYSGK